MPAVAHCGGRALFEGDALLFWRRTGVELAAGREDLSAAVAAEAEARPAVVARASRSELLKASLVVGNPTMPPVTSFSGTVVRLAALPNAGAEAGWLAGRLGSAFLTAGQATEWMVRRRLPSRGSRLGRAGRGRGGASERRVARLGDPEGWSKDRLAPYKVPQALRVVPALLRNAMGKVTKPEVAALFREG